MMDSIDARAELNYSSRDPQFQEPDAYDQDAWLDYMMEAEEHIDDAIRALNAANEEHEIPGGERIVKCLLEASARLEDAR